VPKGPKGAPELVERRAQKRQLKACSLLPFVPESWDAGFAPPLERPEEGLRLRSRGGRTAEHGPPPGRIREFWKVAVGAPPLSLDLVGRFVFSRTTHSSESRLRRSGEGRTLHF